MFRTYRAIPVCRPDTPVLDRVDMPDDVRALNTDELYKLVDDLRAFLLYTVGQTGGHFGAGLGVIELSVALHRIFHTPEDKLVWDVGHQAYPHKMLTGRKSGFSRLRQEGGLSAFPKRTESRYDAFGVGHSSTSISAVLGMAIAARLQGIDRQHIAVIGDGAMTAGMAYEALNHCVHINANVLIVLNDNEMSISESIGGLTRPKNGSPEPLFNELGLAYTGPIDGHDLDALLALLSAEQSKSGTRLIHVKTTKGKGFLPAESDPIGYHALSKIEPVRSPEETLPLLVSAPKYQDLFGRWLVETAEFDSQLVAITPAMREGSGMVEYAERYPDRFFDVNIAEQHAVTLAAGMACEGLKPVVAIYSTFLQRAYDQLIHDVALQNLDVTFAVDRAGPVGEDGPSHAGAFDLSFLRCIPNLVVLAPSCSDELHQALNLAYRYKGPALVRYPRGAAHSIDGDKPQWVLGQAQVCRQGSRVAILAFGTTLSVCLAAAEVLNDISATVVNMRFVKPVDERQLKALAADHSLVVTVEENAIMGGAGSQVSEIMSAYDDWQGRVLSIGLPDQFQDQASRERLLEQAGVSIDHIVALIRKATFDTPI